MAAKAICGNCVVLEKCRDEALTMSHLQTRGVIGGEFVNRVRNARRWRTYEESADDKAPNVPRPEWLATNEVAQAKQRERQAREADEASNDPPLPPEIPTVAAVKIAVGSVGPPKPKTPRVYKKTPRSARRSFDASSAMVPMALDGADCAAMPVTLVEKYFKPNTKREPTAAAIATMVCEHCPVLGECRTHALNASSVPTSGVIAGLSATELRRGRTWRRYESGSLVTRPSSPRPAWLPRTAASDTSSRSQWQRGPSTDASPP